MTFAMIYYNKKGHNSSKAGHDPGGVSYGEAMKLAVEVVSSTQIFAGEKVVPD